MTNGSGFPQTHQLIIEEIAVDHPRITVNHIAYRSRIGIAAVKHIAAAAHIKRNGVNQHLRRLILVLPLRFIAVQALLQQALALAVNLRPRFHGDIGRRHRSAPQMAASDAVGAAPQLHADGVIDNDAIVEVRVMLVRPDADVAAKPLHGALAVHVIADQLIDMSAAASAYVQAVLYAVVQRSIRQREMMRVGNGQAAGKTVALDIAAADEQAEIIVHRAVFIKQRQLMVIPLCGIFQHEIHAALRNQPRRRMHIQRAAVPDVQGPINGVIALGDTQNAVGRGVNSALDACRIACFTVETGEFRQNMIVHNLFLLCLIPVKNRMTRWRIIPVNSLFLHRHGRQFFSGIQR